MLAPARRDPTEFTASAPIWRAAETAKKTLKAEWMTLADFRALRANLGGGAYHEQVSAGQPAAWLRHRVARNAIDRATGTVLQPGGLYFVDEYWPGTSPGNEAGRRWDIYVSTDLSSDKIEKLFSVTGEMGFGRDAGLGRGRFIAQVENAPTDLFAFAGNRMVSLSHGSLSPNMYAPRYRLHTHYGKLGPMYASSEPPFKHPLVLLRPGATFEAGGEGPFGALLTGVHPERPEVVHNAWHLTLPFTEAA
jgi:CRISPR-associated protein Csm4